ncbi:MAG: helix-turn-helix domain-containing protein [Halobacteria archaeon]|nr:helix-turn-helix domain-containing protein [Halobacteria archaeon]
MDTPRLKDDEPDLQEVLDALNDPDCREILHQADEPMTADELSESCDIPQSTLYRKLDLLTDASMLEETVELRSDGRHTSRYRRDVDEIRVSIDDEAIEVEISKPSQEPDQRLAKMWEEVRRET